MIDATNLLNIQLTLYGIALRLYVYYIPIKLLLELWIEIHAFDLSMRYLLTFWGLLILKYTDRLTGEIWPREK